MDTLFTRTSARFQQELQRQQETFLSWERRLNELVVSAEQTGENHKSLQRDVMLRLDKFEEEDSVRWRLRAGKEVEQERRSEEIEARLFTRTQQEMALRKSLAQAMSSMGGIGGIGGALATLPSARGSSMTRSRSVPQSAGQSGALLSRV